MIAGWQVSQATRAAFKEDLRLLKSLDQQKDLMVSVHKGFQLGSTWIDASERIGSIVASALGASSRMPSLPSHLLAHLDMFNDMISQRSTLKHLSRIVDNFKLWTPSQHFSSASSHPSRLTPHVVSYDGDGRLRPTSPHARSVPPPWCAPSLSSLDCRLLTRSGIRRSCSPTEHCTLGYSSRSDLLWCDCRWCV